jgi:hypothetical protein
VAPGEYKLLAQTTVEGKLPATPLAEAAALTIVVDGTDITNLTLATTSGWSAKGQVVSEAGTPPSIPLSQIRLAGRVMDNDTAPTNVASLMGADSGRVKEDWTFTVSPLFGAARLAATMPDGWAVKAILHDGEDITDRAVEMKSGDEMSEIQVIVTDRVTTVSGRLTDDKGAPLTDGTVIVFAEDAEKWVEDSRWVRAARPDQQGHYQIQGLPTRFANTVRSSRCSMPARKRCRSSSLRRDKTSATEMTRRARIPLRKCRVLCRFSLDLRGTLFQSPSAGAHFFRR